MQMEDDSSASFTYDRHRAQVLTEACPRAEYTKELHLLANDCTGACSGRLSRFTC